MAGKNRNPIMRLVPIKHRMHIRKFFRLKKHKGNDRYCTLCESSIKGFLPVNLNNPHPNFKDSGFITRENARCPICGSIERHRLIYMYLKNKTNIFKPPLKKLLHTAPELLLTEKFLMNKQIEYISSDIDPKKTAAMLRIDLTDINLPDHTFDVIISSHVLEHIVDDKKALSEIFRVLKPGGWALILVPIIAEKTFVLSDVKDDKERFQFYGKEDHVRGYGFDFYDLLKNAGFKVKVIDYAKEFKDEEIQNLGLLKGDLIYHCMK